jgi:hypothetical protein
VPTHDWLRRKRGNTPPRLLVVLHNLGALKQERGELGAALDLYKLCARVAEAAFGAAELKTLRECARVAAVLVQLRRWQPAEAVARRLVRAHAACAALPPLVSRTARAKGCES